MCTFWDRHMFLYVIKQITLMSCISFVFYEWISIKMFKKNANYYLMFRQRVSNIHFPQVSYKNNIYLTLYWKSDAGWHMLVRWFYSRIRINHCLKQECVIYVIYTRDRCWSATKLYTKFIQVQLVAGLDIWVNILIHVCLYIFISIWFW